MRVEPTESRNDIAEMAMLGMFFFIFYGVGIPVTLFSMLYKAKINHTMGSVMTKEKFGWIYTI